MCGFILNSQNLLRAAVVVLVSSWDSGFVFLSRKAKRDLGLFYVLLKEIFLYDTWNEEQDLRFLM